MRGLVLALLLAPLFGACRAKHQPVLQRGAYAPLPEDGRTVPEDPLRETGTIRLPGGREVKHGREVERWPDRTLRAERHFDHGKPTGRWRSFHADGVPRSDVDFGAGNAPATMRWWHPDGTLAAEGPSLAGAREGTWTFWHANGARAEEGAFRASRREGPWTFWTPDGAKQAEGRYEAGLRVGEWKLWDADGALHVRTQGVAPGRP